MPSEARDLTVLDRVFCPRACDFDHGDRWVADGLAAIARLREAERRYREQHPEYFDPLGRAAA